MPIELAEQPPSELAPIADAVTTALAEVGRTNTSITEHLTAARALGEQYKDVAFAVATVKGMDDACKARAAIREQRYAIQNLQDTGSKTLTAMRTQFNDRVRDILAEVQAIEAPIDQQIKAEEARKEAVRLARQQAEAKRREAAMEGIAIFSRAVTDAARMTSAQIAELLETVTLMEPAEDDFGEFLGMATQARADAIQKLGELREAAVAEEAELEAERQRQAAFKRQQEEQAARQRELDEREARLREAEERQRQEAEAIERAKRERAEAVQRRIDAFAAHVEEMRGASSHQILVALDTMGEVPISSHLFDDRVPEAEAVRQRAVAQLNKLRSEALEREVEAARKARAAEAQCLIDRISSFGKDNEGYGIDSLKERLQALGAIEVTQEAFGERFDEAAQAKLDATAALSDAVDAAIEREAKEAQEAEERALKEAIVRAAEKRRQRIIDRAERIYILMRDMCSELRGLNAPGSDAILLIEDAEKIIHEVEVGDVRG